MENWTQHHNMEAINDTGVISLVTGDQTFQLRFGMPANRMLMTRWAAMPNFHEHLNEPEVAYLLYAGYVNACMARNEQPTKEFEFFYEIVEDFALNEAGTAVLTEIAACYANSKQTKKYVEDVKKKTEEILMQHQTGTLSNPSVTENSDLNQSNTTA